MIIVYSFFVYLVSKFGDVQMNTDVFKKYAVDFFRNLLSSTGGLLDLSPEMFIICILVIYSRYYVV